MTYPNYDTRTLSAHVFWETHERPDGETLSVIVHFKAGGWQPYVDATYWQPAEGGMFEDAVFDRLEVDGAGTLTGAEIEAATAWFDSEGAYELKQSAAADVFEKGRYDGPDYEQDPARDELQFADEGDDW